MRAYTIAALATGAIAQLSRPLAFGDPQQISSLHLLSALLDRLSGRQRPQEPCQTIPLALEPVRPTKPPPIAQSYRQFLYGMTEMEALDRLITAGLGDRCPQWTITREEFEAAMRVTPDVKRVEWLPIPWNVGRKRRARRQRAGAFPRYAQAVGGPRARYVIGRAE